MNRKKRGRLVVAIVAALALLLIALHEPIARRTFRERPESVARPVSAEERAFLAPWRSLDRQPPVEMCVVPFTMTLSSDPGPISRIEVENTSDRFLPNVWFFREDMPNFYSAPSIVESATRGLDSETEKALALLDLFRRYYANAIPTDDGGLLNDPSTVFAVVGSAQCNNAVKVL